MDILKILLLIILVLIISNILKERFYNPEENMVRKTKSSYETAYELGVNYLNIMNERDYYNLKYPAVMFDIDDTLISINGDPIKPIIRLLNKCIAEKLMIIIITARSSIFYNETVDELLSNKIKYNYLFMRGPNDNIQTFKSNIKKNLANSKDINIIMSIGDNWIDVNGEYSGYWIKLPNDNDSSLYHLNNDGLPELINI